MGVRRGMSLLARNIALGRKFGLKGRRRMKREVIVDYIDRERDMRSQCE